MTGVYGWSLCYSFQFSVCLEMFTVKRVGEKNKLIQLSSKGLAVNIIPNNHSQWWEIKTFTWGSFWRCLHVTELTIPLDWIIRGSQNQEFPSGLNALLPTFTFLDQTGCMRAAPGIWNIFLSLLKFCDSKSDTIYNASTRWTPQQSVIANFENSSIKMGASFNN